MATGQQQIFRLGQADHGRPLTAAEFAEAHDLAAGAGSDAHVPLALGAAYVEMPDFDGPQDFLEQLRHARPVGHHWDQARPWSARVLPSTTAG